MQIKFPIHSMHTFIPSKKSWRKKNIDRFAMALLEKFTLKNEMQETASNIHLS